jgi:hypothetical protein
MTVSPPLQLPWRLLLLDLTGTLLIAPGLYELFNPGAGLLPGSLSFPCHERALIAAGLAILLPAVSGRPGFLAQARRR